MRRRPKGTGLGGTDYRDGALERIRESHLLLSHGYFAGSVYLAGRGVEGMLRALIWLSDAELRRRQKSLETGHDLRELLTAVRDLGLLRPDGRDELEAAVQRVGRLWVNNLR